MLGKCRSKQLAFAMTPSTAPPYAVADPQVEVLDEMSARLSATFEGPPGSSVIGRAWISDADGTLVDGETGEIPAGSQAAMLLTIPESKAQNGNLIACLRVEWPLFQTKHVILCTLIEGKLLHPPKGKEC